MTANTVEQFKVIQFINKAFNPHAKLKLEPIDRYTIKVTDIDNNSMLFKYDSTTNKVITY